MHPYCCNSFARQADRRDNADGGFELLDDGTWGINGCCGGGCYVVAEMKFCPFCGAGVASPITPSSEDVLNAKQASR
jgi:hypothetical protein